MRLSVLSSAFVAAVVGFAGTLAILISAATAVGATQTQTASWVTAICLAKLAESSLLSWWYRVPIVTAWSTAGLALIAASQGQTMEQAVGAFILAGLMLTLTGLVRPLTRLVELIPPPVSAGMLAGILLPFAMGAARAAEVEPTIVIALSVLFFVVQMKSPPLAVVAVLLASVPVIMMSAGGDAQTPGAIDLKLSTLEWTRPQFTMQAFAGLAIPLYLVTMASQNLPGLAVLRASGYNPPAGPLIAVTGFFSTISAFFGASTTNLAAITAAICTGPDAHPDASRRWLTGMFYAGFYGLFAVFGASLVTLFALLPSYLVALVAGLALLAPLANAAGIAMNEQKHRIEAMATFAVTASGIAFFGIGAAFWGLVAGLTIHGTRQFISGRNKQA
ncbi:MAG: benzoate/H(+) symporter BenE family transporter [Rhizobiaceae bacterium]